MSVPLRFSVKLEIGPHRSSSEQVKIICRLVINGERKGKLTLTKTEALSLATILANGATKSEADFVLSVSDR